MHKKCYGDEKLIIKLTTSFISSAEFLYEIQVDIGSQSIDAKSERGKIFIQIIGDRKETEMTEVTRG